MSTYRIEAAVTDATDRPFYPAEQLFGDPEHGVQGHVGHRCGPCAYLATEHIVEISPTGPDHWQNLQLSWQEDCDVIFRQFDDAVAAHFPQHLPANCPDCPETPPLPPKPIPPVERATAQNAR